MNYSIKTIEAFERAAKHNKAEKKAEYISKQEVLDGIRQGLTEFYRAQRTGEKQKTLQELIDEL